MITPLSSHARNAHVLHSRKMLPLPLQQMRFAGKKDADDKTSGPANNNAFSWTKIFLYGLMLSSQLIGGVAAMNQARGLNPLSNGRGLARRTSEGPTDGSLSLVGAVPLTPFRRFGRQLTEFSPSMLDGNSVADFKPQFNKTIDSLVPDLTDSQALSMLKRPPFQPTDLSIFNNEVYGALKSLPAANRTILDEDVKNSLSDTLTERFGEDAPEVEAGMELFENAELKSFVPDARLRGAIVNLQGTLGEAAIDTFRNGTFSTVRFANLPASAIGRVVIPFGKIMPEVEINSRYQYEDFRLLSKTLAHEALHQDKTISVAEERLAHSLDTLIYAQMILENPELISNSTELTQRYNTKLLARLNTRDEDGQLRLFSEQGNVYPGGKVSLTNFGSAFSDIGLDSPGVTKNDTSPGNALLRDMLAKASGQQENDSNFDTTSETLVDQGQTMLDPVDLIALAKVLKLDTGDIPEDEPLLPDSPPPQTSGASRRARFLWF